MQTEVTSWKEYSWPDWVPLKVRQQVEHFWRPQSLRTPQQWMEDAQRNNAPEMGTIITRKRLASRETAGPRRPNAGDICTGRYVHCWNNIGRLIHEDGAISYVCCDPDRV